jgi:hypothetical protein
MRLAAPAVLAVSLLAAVPARAVDVADGTLSVNGFGQAGYGRTNGNTFLVGNEEGQYQNSTLALTVTARPAERLTVAGQLFFDASGEAAADWAFAEWSASDLLRLRVGKIKQPLGLSMEVLDVGTLRPFFTLPVSIYGPANMGAEAYYGAGITGEAELGAWGLGYDLYGGEIVMHMYQPFELAVAAPGGPWDFSTAEHEEANARNVIGGRVTLTTPLDGLSFRASAFSGTRTEIEGGTAVEKLRTTVVGVSAEYAVDRFALRGELFRESEGDFETAVAGYVEGAAFVTERLQLAARVEGLQLDAEDFTGPPSLLRHREAAVGVNYWLRPELVFKVSFHAIKGNRFAVPSGAASGPLPDRTNLVIAGAQLSF